MTDLCKPNHNSVLKLDPIEDAAYNQASSRDKIGEIYRLSPDHLSFVCSHCNAEFPVLIQFTVHIEKHLLDIHLDYIESNGTNSAKFEDVDIKPDIGSNFEACAENIELVIIDGVQNSGADLDYEESFESIEVNKFDFEGICSDADVGALAKDDSSERPTRAYECHVCQSQIATLDEYGRHMSDASACGRASQEKSAGAEHKILYEKKFQCDVCDRRFLLKRSLRRHLISKHRSKNEIAEIFKCSICDKDICSAANLRLHMRRHTGQNVRHCSQCNYKCPSQSELNKHMTSHSDRREFQCDLCPKAYKRKFILDMHRRSHFGDTPSKSDDRQYQCEQCGVRFKIKTNLKRHMVIHTGERNYKCDMCPKTFSFADNLLVHKRRHTGNFIHNCNLCDKGFVEKRSLKKHSIMVHGKPLTEDA